MYCMPGGVSFTVAPPVLWFSSPIFLQSADLVVLSVSGAAVGWGEAGETQGHWLRQA